MATKTSDSGGCGEIPPNTPSFPLTPETPSTVAAATQRPSSSSVINSIYIPSYSCPTCDPVFINDEPEKITSEPSIPVKIQRKTDHQFARSIQTESVKRVLRSNHVEDHSWQHEPSTDQSPRDDNTTHDSRPEMITTDESSASQKPKGKKKRKDDPSLVQPDPSVLQESIVQSFSEMLEDFCGRAEVPDDDMDEAEWSSVSVDEVRVLVNELMTIRSKMLLHMVPVDTLSRLLHALDHQIHRAEGLSVYSEHSDSDSVLLVLGALESIHASLAVMANSDMPKQLYKEEIIERILEFSRHQMMAVMSAYDPSYRTASKPELIFGPTEYTTIIDVGSAGCVLTEFLLGQMFRSLDW